MQPDLDQHAVHGSVKIERERIVEVSAVDFMLVSIKIIGFSSVELELVFSAFLDVQPKCLIRIATEVVHVDVDSVEEVFEGFIRRDLQVEVEKSQSVIQIDVLFVSLDCSARVDKSVSEHELPVKIFRLLLGLKGKGCRKYKYEKRKG
jgi:hypothetical protein